MLPFRKSVQVIMKKRRSCRNFSDEILTQNTLSSISNACKTLKCSRYFFDLVYSNRYKNYYLLGRANAIEKHYLDFSYDFEQLILFCTDLGLKTCWTGVFPSKYFRSISTQTSFKSIYIVSPVGYSTKEPSEKYRKPWNEVFFNKSTMNPLEPLQVGDYVDSLEMIRIAPSAMNLQPWRILYEKNTFHFFLARSSGIIGYGMKKAKVDFQMIDIGIAISHFDLTNKEKNLSGQWTNVPNVVINPQWEYVVSFTF